MGRWPFVMILFTRRTIIFFCSVRASDAKTAQQMGNARYEKPTIAFHKFKR